MQFYCMQWLFCCIRLYNKLFFKELPKTIKKVDSSHIPWLWIGAELTDGNITSLTDLVNGSVEYDDVITPSYLEDISNVENAKRWVYVDSKTLKEEEIPAHGLVIEDDSDE